MADYQASSTDSRSFELTKDHLYIGKLIYKSWFKFNAEIETASFSSYQIEPKGFWGTTIELRNGDLVLLQFKMNWNGAIVIQTHFDGHDRDYLFKHKGLLKSSFILTDAAGAELMEMKPHMKWSKVNFEYQISTAEEFESLSNKDLLLLSILHCANYYMTMMAGAA